MNRCAACNELRGGCEKINFAGLQEYHICPNCLAFSKAPRAVVARLSIKKKKAAASGGATTLHQPEPGFDIFGTIVEDKK